MTFDTLEALLKYFVAKGCNRILCKQLAENDNSKQQVYLGSSFEVLKLLPFGSVSADSAPKRQNFKAKLNFSWVGDDGHPVVANGAQLILYPDYPEVRLSGFLIGCSAAPSKLMQPVPALERRHNSGPDGRVLFLGTTPSGSLIAFLAPASSAISAAVSDRILREAVQRFGVFFDFTPISQPDFREILLDLLRAIHRKNPHAGQRLDSSGDAIPYVARNAGGYTLEALLGIRPNGRALPDLMGWEIKAYRGSRITLMTPEPDGGFYGIQGVQAFVRRFGRSIANTDTIYFTGLHRANTLCVSTGQTIRLTGFDSHTKKITDVAGGIQLVDQKELISAEWSYKNLIDHWGRKHAAAAYVPYRKSIDIPPRYAFDSPALLGEETEFAFFLSELESGHIVYDPASKIENASLTSARSKARSQFRISVKHLGRLYRRFEAVSIE